MKTEFKSRLIDMRNKRKLIKSLDSAFILSLCNVLISQIIFRDIFISFGLLIITTMIAFMKNIYLEKIINDK